MKLIRGLHNLTVQQSCCVATIGKFDGIHCGHQQIIEAVVARAQAMNEESVVILFEPDPHEYFAGSSAPARLTRFREKWQQLERLGIDKVVCLRFGEQLATMDAEHFIDDVLVRRLRVNHLIVGDDFRFGRDRQGDFELLKSRGAGKFTVQATQSIRQGTERISSTLIRQKLAQDELDDVRMLLGRNYSISGRVAHGEKVGRTLGFPTLNIPLLRRVSPVSGVYLVQVTGVASHPIYGVANVGNRPTVNQVKARLEVHLLDFQGECYGKQVTVLFLQKIRDEKKFKSFEQLKEQIAQDIITAKQMITH